MDSDTMIRTASETIWVYDAGRDRRGHGDKGKFAARAEQESGFDAGGALDGEGLRDEPEQHRLDDDEGDGRSHEDLGINGDLAQVDAQADEEEEGAEQKALEGLDDGFDLAAELGFGEQQAGEKGAERHREAGEARGIARSRPQSGGSSP